jgi:hypothetical protein
MRHDIHKLGIWLEKVCQEGIAIEHKILDWKMTEEKKQPPAPQAKAS